MLLRSRTRRLAGLALQCCPKRLVLKTQHSSVQAQQTCDSDLLRQAARHALIFFETTNFCLPPQQLRVDPVQAAVMDSAIVICLRFSAEALSGSAVPEINPDTKAER